MSKVKQVNQVRNYLVRTIGHKFVGAKPRIWNKLAESGGFSNELLTVKYTPETNKVHFIPNFDTSPIVSHPLILAQKYLDNGVSLSIDLEKHTVYDRDYLVLNTKNGNLPARYAAMLGDIFTMQNEVDYGDVIVKSNYGRYFNWLCSTEGTRMLFDKYIFNGYGSQKNEKIDRNLDRMNNDYSLDFTDDLHTNKSSTDEVDISCVIPSRGENATLVIIKGPECSDEYLEKCDNRLVLKPEEINMLDGSNYLNTRVLKLLSTDEIEILTGYRTGIIDKLKKGLKTINPRFQIFLPSNLKDNADKRLWETYDTLVTPSVYNFMENCRLYANDELKYGSLCKAEGGITLPESSSLLANGILSRQDEIPDGTSRCKGSVYKLHNTYSNSYYEITTLEDLVILKDAVNHVGGHATLELSDVSDSDIAPGLKSTTDEIMSTLEL